MNVYIALLFDLSTYIVQYCIGKGMSGRLRLVADAEAERCVRCRT